MKTRKKTKTRTSMNRSVILVLTIFLTLLTNAQSYFTIPELLRICNSKYEPYSGLVDKKGYKVQDVVSWGVNEKVFNFYKGCVIDGNYQIHSISNQSNSSVIAIYVDVMQTGITTRMIETVFSESIYKKMIQDAVNAGYKKEVWTDVTPNKEYYIKGNNPVIEFTAARNQYGVNCYQIDVKVFGYYKAEIEKKNAKKYDDPEYIKTLSISQLFELESSYNKNSIIKEVLYAKLIGEKRYDEAFPLCKRLINLDPYGSKYWEYLGMMYLSGLGTPVNKKESINCLYNAEGANKISSKGKYYLATLLLQTDINEPTALQDYRRAESYFKNIQNEIPEAQDGIKLAQQKIKQYRDYHYGGKTGKNPQQSSSTSGNNSGILNNLLKGILKK